MRQQAGRQIGGATCQPEFRFPFFLAHLSSLLCDFIIVDRQQNAEDRAFA
jgi:hypothetical protein